MNVRKSISDFLSEVNSEEQQFEIGSVRVVLTQDFNGEADVEELELTLKPVEPKTSIEGLAEVVASQTFTSTPPA